MKKILLCICLGMAGFNAPYLIGTIGLASKSKPLNGFVSQSSYGWDLVDHYLSPQFVRRRPQAAATAPITVAFDAATTSTTSSFSHTVTGTNTCLTVLFGTSGGTVTGVTYNGVSMTQRSSELTNGAGPHRAYTYSLVAPASGSNTVAITGGTVIWVVAASWTGVHQTTAIGGISSTNGTASNISAPGISGCVSGDAKIAVFVTADDGETISASSGTFIGPGGSSGKAAAARNSGTGGIGVSTVNQTGDWASAGFCVKQVG